MCIASLRSDERSSVYYTTKAQNHQPMHKKCVITVKVLLMIYLAPQNNWSTRYSESYREGKPYKKRFIQIYANAINSFNFVSFSSTIREINLRSVLSNNDCTPLEIQLRMPSFNSGIKNILSYYYFTIISLVKLTMEWMRK